MSLVRRGHPKHPNQFEKSVANVGGCVLLLSRRYKSSHRCYMGLNPVTDWANP